MPWESLWRVCLVIAVNSFVGDDLPSFHTATAALLTPLLPILFKASQLGDPGGRRQAIVEAICIILVLLVIILTLLLGFAKASCIVPSLGICILFQLLATLYFILQVLSLRTTYQPLFLLALCGCSRLSATAGPYKYRLPGMGSRQGRAVGVRNVQSSEAAVRRPR